MGRVLKSRKIPRMSRSRRSRCSHDFSCFDVLAVDMLWTVWRGTFGGRTAKTSGRAGSTIGTRKERT